MSAPEHSRAKKVEPVAFTEANVKKLKTGEYSDKVEVPYLRLQVSEGGATKNWSIYKWIAERGHAVRRSIGSYQDFGVDEARERARGIYSELKKPQGKGVPSAETTLGDALAQYTKKLESSNPPTKQPRWADEVFRRKGVYDDWLNMPMAQITELMLDDRQVSIRKTRGPAAATRALKALRAVYEFAIKRKLFTGDNVGRSVDLVESAPRKRVLNNIERDKVVAALDDDQFKFTYVRPFIRLLMLTGVRWGNLAAAKWEDIDLENRVWTIPEASSKMGNEMRIRLRAEAIELFREQVGKHSEWVFPSPKDPLKKKHIQEPGYAWLRVLQVAQLEAHATLHDLRRTFGSVLIRDGTPMEVVKEALGHRSIMTTEKHYAFLDDETVQRHLDRVKA